MDIEERLQQLDLLLEKCTQKYQEGINKADKLLSQIREHNPGKSEKKQQTEDTQNPNKK